MFPSAHFTRGGRKISLSFYVRVHPGLIGQSARSIIATDARLIIGIFLGNAKALQQKHF